MVIINKMIIEMSSLVDNKLIGILKFKLYWRIYDFNLLNIIYFFFFVYLKIFF